MTDDAHEALRPPALRITADELVGPEIDERVRRMQEAAAPPLIQQVGAPTTPSTSTSFGLIASMAIAGLIGGIAGWAFSELVTQQWRIEEAIANLDFDDLFNCDADQLTDCIFQPWYGSNKTVSAILWLGCFGVALGAAIAGWDAVTARSWAKFRRLFGRAVPLLLGAAILGGWIAQEVYESMLEGLDLESFERSDLHLPRGISWAVFGTALGAAIGGSTRSGKRTLNGMLGGAIGAFVGGFAFDYIRVSETNGIPNRLIGFAITGVAVGASIALIEVARREHWIEILSGGMAGKQFILHHDETTVGSSPVCDITLIKDPAISAKHAVLARRGEALSARALDPSAAVLINGSPVHEQVVRDGDLLQVGSTLLRYRSKEQSMPTGSPMPGGPGMGVPGHPPATALGGPAGRAPGGWGGATVPPPPPPGT